jgi:prepilin-type processing-associated H-X9-DG protein
MILETVVNRNSISLRNGIYNLGTSSGVPNQGRYDFWKCPADDLARNPLPQYVNFPPRSYAINQSKWAYGLGDGTNNDAQSPLQSSTDYVGVHGKAAYKMPWSGGCSQAFPGSDPNRGIPTGNPGDLGTSAGAFVKQCKLSEVPPWIWVLGENWGTTGAYTLPNNSSPLPTINFSSENAVFGTYEEAFLDGSPARFHGNSKWNGAVSGGTILNANSMNLGGNYAYADGHVEFIRYGDVANIRSDSKYFGKYVLQDHWKWYTNK